MTFNPGEKICIVINEDKERDEILRKIDSFCFDGRAAKNQNLVVSATVTKPEVTCT